MADVRTKFAVKVVDPTTDSQELAISAAGAALVDTELPAAAAITDVFANPTVPGVMGFNMGFNGTTWDRLQVDGSKFLKVTLAASAATVTVDTELPAAAALADTTANPTVPGVGAFNMIETPGASTWDRVKAVVAAMDSTGVGIQAAGMIAQFDDVATAAVTENQFAPPRISTRRALLVEGVASGTNLNVNLAASAATVTVDTELPAAAAITDAFANPTVPGVMGFTMGWNGATWDRLQVDGSKFLKIAIAASSATVTVDTELVAVAALADATANPTVTSVGVFAMGYNGATWDRIRTANTGRLQVDVTSTTGTVTVDTELPAAATLADATANPSLTAIQDYMMGYNGTTWDRIRTANTGRLQVDVITGGGSDSATTPVVTVGTSAALAAGASVNVDTADIATKKCWGVDATCSVAFKAVVSTLTNGSATSVVVLFGDAGQVVQWRPPRRDWVVSGSSAGADGFRVAFTNLDGSRAADVYATFYTADN